MGMRKRGRDAILQRAQKKLEHVATSWAEAMPASAVASSLGELEWKIGFEPGSIEFDELALSYQVRSKLFATLFDLRCRICCAAGTPAPSHDVSLTYDPRMQRLTEKLDEGSSIPLDGLLVERIEKLGVTRLTAALDASSSAWSITMDMLVGSSTWNLIPPVMHLISPSDQECIWATELLRMLVSTVRALRI